jgi:hypothetical protein
VDINNPKNLEQPKQISNMAGKEDNLRKIIASIEESARKQDQVLKEHTTRLQTELIVKIEDMARRLDTLEGLIGNKAKPRVERKVAAATTGGAGATAANGGNGKEEADTPAPAKTIISWTQYLSHMFETDNAHYAKMTAKPEHRAVVDGAAGLDKLKTEGEKRRKMATALVAWLKVNDTELVKTIQAEHKAYKAAAAKAPAAKRQKADHDSDDGAGADAGANGADDADVV